MQVYKIFSDNKVLNEDLYKRLQALDSKVFYGCINEFKPSREWWVIVDGGSIIAYCGSTYSEGYCFYNRAWVYTSYRGLGLHKKLIDIRVRAAKKKKCKAIVTYTTHNNAASMNNLFKCKFKAFIPEFKYSGTEMVYYRRMLTS